MRGESVENLWRVSRGSSELRRVIGGEEAGDLGKERISLEEIA